MWFWLNMRNFSLKTGLIITRFQHYVEMSEAAQVQAQNPTQVVHYVPIVYDPARRKKRARRARRADPIVVYDPDPRRRRRRARRADPIRGATGKTMIDGVVDGVAFGYLSTKVPIQGSIGPVTVQDAVAVGGAVLYEKFVMKRSWMVAFISGAVAYGVRRWLG